VKPRREEARGGPRPGGPEDRAMRARRCPLASISPRALARPGASAAAGGPARPRRRADLGL